MILICVSDPIFAYLKITPPEIVIKMKQNKVLNKYYLFIIVLRLFLSLPYLL